LIKVAARPVARVWPVMLVGVPLMNVAHKKFAHRMGSYE
jgi:hypothetical protein